MNLSIIDNHDVAFEESPILDSLEQYAQFIDELYDVRHNRSVFYEENVGRIAIRSVRRVLREWNRAYNPNRPPSALIVRLARRLPHLLTDVVNQPKKILQRRRTMEPIHRLRELDATCVRWLTRQPGNTLAEKSGNRRAVLAVHRFESVDTLENRVVRDLLQRCISLATSYLRQHAKKFPDHDWVIMTADLLKLCRRLLALPHMQEISSLPSLPKPNYVLLHESRYQEVWRSYMEVIRQQRRRQQLWKWRHEAFAEMVTIGWMSSASRLMLDPTARCTAHRFDLRVKESVTEGRFFDWSALPPIWKMNTRASFYVGPVESIKLLLPSISTRFESTNGFGIVRWFDSKVHHSRLQVTFKGDIGCGENGIEQETTVSWNDPQSRTHAQSNPKSIVLPIRLIEQPAFLDRYVDDWCMK